MISTSQLTDYIENGLNTLFNSPESPVRDANLAFKIYPTAGQKTPALRDGNSVIQYIDGNLLSESSANEANVLAMGYNGLRLEFGVPLQQPKTISTQTAAQLEKLRDYKYPFVEYIKEIINGFFAVAVVTQMTDSAGALFTVTITAGLAVDGVVDLIAQANNFVPITINIGVEFLEGGVSGRDIVLTVDGGRVPELNKTIGRSNRMESEVYSDSSQSVKNAVNATALSIDFSFPANSDNLTAQAIIQILDGSPNVAHFVEVRYPGQDSRYYLMLFDNLQNDSEGVKFARMTASLIEATDNVVLLDFPPYFQIGAFAFNSSTGNSVTFNSPDCLAYIGGKVSKIEAGEQTITLTPNDFIYDPVAGNYKVYLITLGTAEITSAIPFTVIKAAQNG